MNKNTTLLFSSLLLFGCSHEELRPNVILILTDDQGWGDLNVNGNDLINTPNLDKLYAESAVMNQFHVSPLSAPTRAALLTGRYHLSTGVSHVSSGLENMNPEETTIAELFKDAGYATGCFGKWHSGTYYPYTPNGQGFEEFLGFCCGHWTNYFDPILQHNEEMTTGEGFISDILTDAAIDFIKDNKEKPFFCYIPYNAPHAPFQVPDEYYDKYDHIEAKTESERNAIATIYAMVENVDYNIGRIFSAIDDEKIRENTVVVFMTDNGPTFAARYNGGMRGMKGQAFQGSVRVPCFFNWKGKIDHKVVNYPSAHIDMLPTLMDICGIEGYKTTNKVDGVSLKPLVFGEKSYLGSRDIGFHVINSRNEPTIWNIEEELSPSRSGGIIRDSLRFVIYRDDTLAFNLDKDPCQKMNIYDNANKEHQDLLKSYLNWFETVTSNVKNGQVLVPVGYDEGLEVRIPTPEGGMNGALKCYGYPNQNWVNHFQEKKDSLNFNLDIVDSALYQIVLEYSSDYNGDDGKVCLEVGDYKVESAVPYFPTQQVPSPDRVKRGEAYQLILNQLTVGEVFLEKGEKSLTLYAENIPLYEGLKIKTVIIRKLKRD